MVKTNGPMIGILVSIIVIVVIIIVIIFFINSDRSGNKGNVRKLQKGRITSRTCKVDSECPIGMRCSNSKCIPISENTLRSQRKRRRRSRHKVLTKSGGSVGKTKRRSSTKLRELTNNDPVVDSNKQYTRHISRSSSSARQHERSSNPPPASEDVTIKQETQMDDNTNMRNQPNANITMGSPNPPPNPNGVVILKGPQMKRDQNGLQYYENVTSNLNNKLSNDQPQHEHNTTNQNVTPINNIPVQSPQIINRGIDVPNFKGKFGGTLNHNPWEPEEDNIYYNNRINPVGPNVVNMSVRSEFSSEPSFKRAWGYDGPVDVRSNYSDSDAASSISEVHFKHNTNELCRYDGMVVDGNKINVTSIVDVIGFSRYVIFLYDDGKFLVESDDDRRRIMTDVKMDSIYAYDGNIFGLSDGSLYSLDMSSFEGNNWIFHLEEIYGNNIVWVNVTHNQDFLWVQNGEDGMLYNIDRNCIRRDFIPKYIRRYYGMSDNIYIDLNINTCSGIHYPSSKEIKDAISLAIDHYGNIITITKENGVIYNKIKLVNWVPYYLRL